MREATGAVCAIFLGAFLTSAAAGQGLFGPDTSVEPPLDEAVAGAIQKGVEHLWSLRGADGSWPAYVAGDKTFTMGPTALAAYALLEAGVDPQEERMAKTIDWLAKHDEPMVYSLALRCQVWLIVNRKLRGKYTKEFEADVKRLMLSTANGAYAYEAAGDGKNNNGNLSTSQFAVLGVWAGARANMEFIGPKYWAMIRKFWLDQQLADGGWTYTQPYYKESWPSMTAAGVATLFVCADYLQSDAYLKCQTVAGPEQKALERGLAWLEKNFEESIKPDTKLAVPWSGFVEYYLYVVERVGLASGYKYFGQADWYKLGARTLLRRQAPAGGWGALSETSFAILFLNRGRNPVLFNRLEYKGDWNNRPRALANLTEYISKSFEGTVNWQIVNLKAPVHEWHDAPILLLSGSKLPAFTDEELAKLRTYILQGGTILSIAECDGMSFAGGMRKAYAKLFPEYELKQAPKDHPLYTLQFKLAGRPTLYILTNGVRPLAIHVEQDMVLPWQGRMEKTEAWAFQAAANVYLYATDKGSLRARGANVWPEEPAAAPARKIKVARLKYAGNWDPEPLAYERLGRLLAAEEHIGLDVTATPIKDLPVGGAAVASLTGTAALQMSDEEREALKQFVTGGGLLVVDAAGGSKAFADSADAVLGEVFGEGALKRLSADAALYAAKPIKEFKYRRQTRERASNPKEPMLKAVTVEGRLGAILSREDLTCGLVGYASYACDGYAPQTAYEIMRNVLLMAAKGSASSKPAAATAPSQAGQE
jgi:hypothetical protein